MIKIIGGQYKGRKLAVPQTQDVRPTSNRMRESLFNKLMHAKWRDGFDLDQARVLDLFCGSGALGIEALSRGAAHCTFVDIDMASIQTNTDIVDNDTYSLVKAALPQGLPPNLGVFDIIFMDPPYRQNLLTPTIQQLITHGCINAQTLIIIEAEQGVHIDKTTLTTIDQIKQATSQIDILRYHPAI